MCISCGCGKYTESHGDERNVTVGTLQRAAEASNLKLDEVLRATQQACSQMLQQDNPDGHAVLVAGDNDQKATT